jgi:hypothetical protein
MKQQFFFYPLLTACNLQGKHYDHRTKLYSIIGLATLALIALAGLGKYQMNSIFKTASYGSDNTAPSLKTIGVINDDL